MIKHEVPGKWYLQVLPEALRVKVPKAKKEPAGVGYKPNHFRQLKMKWFERMRSEVEKNLDLTGMERRRRLEALWYVSKARADAIAGLSRLEISRRRLNVPPGDHPQWRRIQKERGFSDGL